MQFSRTVAPDTSKGPALIAFMQHNKWRKIAMVSSTESLWFETRLGLAKQLEDASITVLRPAAFESGNVKDSMLSELFRSGIRIVMVLAYDADAQSIASLACQAGMLQSWSWLLIDERMASADMHVWLYIRPFLASEAMQAFAKQVSDYSQTDFNITVSPDSINVAYSAALHDAIVLYALGATTVMSAGGNLRDGTAVTAAVRNTSFTGVGDTLVVLDRKGDRIESYEMMNYVLKEGDVMSSVAVGIFNCTQRQYKAYERAVVWPGSTKDVPVDYIEPTCTDEGTEPKQTKSGLQCVTCDGNKYSLRNKCHQCEPGGDCRSALQGFDIVALPGWWRSSPFFRSCVDANTIQVLKKSEAAFEVSAWDSLSSLSALETTRRRAPSSHGKGETSHTSAPSMSSVPRRAEHMETSQSSASCLNDSVVVTSSPSDINKYQGRANMYSCN